MPIDPFEEIRRFIEGEPPVEDPPAVMPPDSGELSGKMPFKGIPSPQESSLWDW